METETKEAILNEDWNNKQKERVKRDFKDKIHHAGMKKEDARDQLKNGSYFFSVINASFIDDCVGMPWQY